METEGKWSESCKKMRNIQTFPNGPKPERFMVLVLAKLAIVSKQNRRCTKIIKNCWDVHAQEPTRIAIHRPVSLRDWKLWEAWDGWWIALDSEWTLGGAPQLKARPFVKEVSNVIPCPWNVLHSSTRRDAIYHTYLFILINYWDYWILTLFVSNSSKRLR